MSKKLNLMILKVLLKSNKTRLIRKQMLLNSYEIQSNNFEDVKIKEERINEIFLDLSKYAQKNIINKSENFFILKEVRELE